MNESTVSFDRNGEPVASGWHAGAWLPSPADIARECAAIRSARTDHREHQPVALALLERAAKRRVRRRGLEWLVEACEEVGVDVS